MTDWLLIYPGRGEQLQHMARVEVHVFRSGDGKDPEPDDMKAAVHEFAARLDRGSRGELVSDTEFEFVLVPLREARLAQVGITQRYAIHQIAALDLGLHVG